MMNTYQEISETTGKIKDRLIEIRRDLHQNPETAGNEVKTSRIIKEFLQSLGLEVITGIGGYGVVGILRGNRSGKVIAWRADIDAVNTDLPDVVDYQSKIKGIRHICGHDVHTAIGLGIAEVLALHKKDVEGTIAFIFQPAEENYTGAAKMIADGILEKLKPEAIFALHTSPLPTGAISVKSGEVFSVIRRIRILLKNEGNMDIVERECKCLLENIPTLSDIDSFFNGTTLLDPQLGITCPTGVYQDYVAMPYGLVTEHNKSDVLIEADFFSSNENNLIIALEQLKKSLSNTEWKDRVKSVGFSFEKPIVYNNKMLTEIVTNKIKSVSTSNPIIPLYGVVPQNNDDFALFQERVPGVYFFLGASDYKNGIICAPHSPNHAVDEKCIEIGINIFSSMIIDYLISNH